MGLKINGSGYIATNCDCETPTTHADKPLAQRGLVGKVQRERAAQKRTEGNAGFSARPLVPRGLANGGDKR